MVASSLGWTALPQPPTGYATWSEAGAALNAPSVAKNKKPEIRHLVLTDSQKTRLNAVYQQESTLLEFKDKPSDQQLAQDKMAELRLAKDQLDALESRWSVQWSTAWSTKAGRKKRTLYQCCSGYDSDNRQIQDSKTQRARDQTSSDKKWERRVPYAFTGCLAHVEVVENTNTGKVERVWGIFEHNEPFSKSVLQQLPAVPVHEHVWEVALDQMAQNARYVLSIDFRTVTSISYVLTAPTSLTAIQDTNQWMIRERRYRGMDTYNSITSNVRYLLLPSDSSTLYSKYGRTLGIDVKVPPQYNISDWLNPDSPRYKPDVARAIFHYSECAEAGDRFEACISTPEMDEAAWRYAHRSQLVLDGTFGVCTVRLLLFIALAIDPNGKGLPVALFLFSAPTGNRATHAGYNTAILQKILQKWENHLTSTHSGSERFSPCSAITDTDTKERGALLKVWPDIILLLCKFHV
ncbi:hypothetical protein AAF712_012179 [Marasmius tenuissimus]|uniref:Transposase n=1 Tax=Marasmius tenuissimus TaxID=585030 RepID=A0ABR2ZJ48_9AGAR